MSMNQKSAFITVQVKPMSVNEAWKGRRFKTNTYKGFREEMMYRLPQIEVPEGKLRVDYIFGYSSSLSDIDNAIKTTTDALQERYEFNDKNIFEMNVKKEIVKKGSEFIKFKITKLE